MIEADSLTEFFSSTLTPSRGKKRLLENHPLRSRLILSLDLGTTGNRAILFDKNLNIVRSAYQEFKQYFPKPGWVEHDPEEIWRSTQAVIRKATAGIDAGRIAGIGITNQRETVVLWDRKSGRPVHRAIVWQDRRTSDVCQALKKRGLEVGVHKKTGLFLDPYFSATKIAWLLDHVPGLRRRATRGDIAFGTIDTWIIWKLTSGTAHITDPSNASRTLLYDLRAKKWSTELCRLFKIPQAVLPKIVPSSGVVAHTAPEIFSAPWGRPKRLSRRLKSASGTGSSARPAPIGLPIAGIAGDQQAATFAQGCFKPGIFKNTYGTGLFILMNTGSKLHVSKKLVTTVAWQIGKKVEYAVEGSIFIGGAALQWLRDGLQIIKKASDSTDLAKSLTDNEGVYFVPALAGLGAPYWNPFARGLISGITRGTTRAHLARAALESMAYQTRDVIEVLKQELHIHPQKLQVDGGASTNDWLMQFQADLLGIPVERPRITETTALGAAGLAGLAVGLWSSPESFAAARRASKLFRPRKSVTAALESAYHGWRAAVRKTLAD